MKIKGKIVEIIPPNQIKNTLASQDNMPIWDFKDTHYLVVVTKNEYPDNYFKKIFYDIKHRKEKYVWSVVMKKCSKKEGDEIEINVKPYYKETRLFIGD